jgi:hypothetical protein
VIDVAVAVTIRRPRPDVAAVMFNPRYDPAWIGGVLRARPAPPGPVRPGTQIAHALRLFGRRMDDVREVVEHVPNRRIEMIAHAFDLRIRYELEGIPEGTIARISARGRPNRHRRIVLHALNLLLRRAVSRDLGRLKSLVESGLWRRLSV